MLGKRVREILLDEDMQVAPLSELLLFAADRAQHVKTLIRPALAKNQIVISDRFADATIAYQGAGRGFDANLVQQLIKIATDGLHPDLTLFFDLPVDESVARTTRRAAQGFESNRLDKENIEFHTRVRDAYLQIATTDPQRFQVINANLPVNEIHAQVLEIINTLLEQKNFAKSKT